MNNTNRYSVFKPRDYEAESRERLAKLEPKEDVISNFDNINDILRIYSQHKTLCEKSQFDTDAEVLEKAEKQIDNIFGKNKTYTIFVQNFNDQLRNVIKYEPEKSKFYCLLPYIRVSIPGQRFAIVLRGGDSKITGSYTGVNAFGVTKEVTKFQGKGILLCSTNGIELEEKISGFEKYSPKSDLTSLAFNSFVINKDIAKEIYKNLGFAITFKPQAVNELGELNIFTHAGAYTSATISSPYQETIKYDVLFGKIISIYLVDKTTGKIYGGYNFY